MLGVPFDFSRFAPLPPLPILLPLPLPLAHLHSNIFRCLGWRRGNWTNDTYVTTCTSIHDLFQWVPQRICGLQIRPDRKLCAADGPFAPNHVDSTACSLKVLQIGSWWMRI